ncbi:MAG: hypothetical protein BWY79_01681 [Actinobacteria bacterium ADurb.Bin444]|nr:MAG: hypothetical protein BWY79_01681 [Actinobacteria bacterium ADurb.Bin444]
MAAICAISAMRSGASSVPVGLAGELMSTALVRGVSAARMSAGRYWKPSSS